LTSLGQTILIEDEHMIKQGGLVYFTIAKGNCSNMKREIAGKITSEVKGRLETTAAVAKEANATSNGIPDQRAVFPAYVRLSMRVHQRRDKQVTVTMPIFLSIFSSCLFLTSRTLRRKLFSQA